MCYLHFCSILSADARFSLFGSSCNGFGFYSSDLDICMTLVGRTVEVRASVYVCLCMCMCVWICISVGVSVYASKHTFVCVCVCVCDVYVCLHVCVCVCVCETVCLGFPPCTY